MELVKLSVDLVEVTLRKGTEQMGFLFADTVLGLSGIACVFALSLPLRKNKHSTIISAEARGVLHISRKLTG